MITFKRRSLYKQTKAHLHLMVIFRGLKLCGMMWLLPPTKHQRIILKMKIPC